MKKLLHTFLKAAAFFLGWAILAGLAEIPSSNPAVWRFWAELVPLLVLLIFTAGFSALEKGKIKIPVLKNFSSGVLTGTVVGFVWIGIAAGVLLLSGQLSITGRSSVPYLWLWVVSAFINVIMQELLIRGYLYQLLKSRYNLATAVALTAVLFAVMHGGAIAAGWLPVINVVTMYLFTAALYEAAGTLAAPIMAHAVWNIVGALFLGGVSLADDYPHLLTLSASANTVLSGGDYKIEASIVTTALNIALLAFFRTRCKGKALQR